MAIGSWTSNLTLFSSIKIAGCPTSQQGGRIKGFLNSFHSNTTFIFGSHDCGSQTLSFSRLALFLLGSLPRNALKSLHCTLQHMKNIHKHLWRCMNKHAHHQQEHFIIGPSWVHTAFKTWYKVIKLFFIFTIALPICPLRNHFMWMSRSPSLTP